MTPRQARLGVDIFTGIVVASVGLALAGLTWRLAGYSGVVPAAAPVTAGSRSDNDIKPLIALAPFGAAVATAAPSGDGPIRLRAIFLAVPVEASTVLITGADGKVASYGLGQAVGGGVIEAIEAEQIVLRMPGGARTISFNPEAGPAMNAPVANSGPAGPGAPLPRGQVPISTAASGADAVRALIPPELRGPTGAQPAPPSNLTGIAQPSRSGGAAGYVVGPTPGAAVIAAGIRSGDVIERVNGRPVNAATNERDLISQAAASGSARVEILRNGTRISLTVPVR